MRWKVIPHSELYDPGRLEELAKQGRELRETKKLARMPSWTGCAVSRCAGSAVDLPLRLMVACTSTWR